MRYDGVSWDFDLTIYNNKRRAFYIEASIIKMKNMIWN